MVACPQLAKADIRPLDSNSVFDPERTPALQQNALNEDPYAR